jgi:hypothetical protein
MQKPHPNTHFSQNTPQNAQQTGAKAATNPPDFFLQTTAFSE